MDIELNSTPKNKIESKSKTDQPADETFSQMLLRFIQERNITVQQLSEILDRRRVHPIRPYTRHKPRTYDVVRLALALKLTLDDTERLLKSAGYELSRSIFKDLVISYCIAHNQYSVQEVNEILESFGVSGL